MTSHNNNASTQQVSPPTSALTSASAPAPAPPVGPPQPPLFDFVLNISHPCSSSSSSNNPATKLQIGPPNAPIFSESHAIYQELVLNEKNQMGHIARCAFPDYSDKYNESQPHPPPSLGSAQLNVYDVYSQNFQNHTFHFIITSKQYGPVVVYARTHHPCHASSQNRGDVGRRAPQCLLMFTRRWKSRKFCVSVLKTVQVVLIQHQSSSSMNSANASTAVQSLLHSLLTQTPHPQSNTISLRGLEFGNSQTFVNLDLHHFVVPPIKQQQNQNLYPLTPILPLLRCLGPHHTVRLLTALLCERRTVLLSSSPSRLSACISAALSMLIHGQLNYKHIVIPTLPPHQFPALGSQVKPYLVGVLTSCARTHRIDLIPGTETVILFDLDTENGMVRLLGHPSLSQNTGNKPNLEQQCPNLARGNLAEGSSQFVSLGENLIGDLMELYKQDKFKYTSSVSAAIQTLSKKSGAAMTAAVRAIGRWRNKAKQQNNQNNEEGGERDRDRSSHGSNSGSNNIHTDNQHGGNDSIHNNSSTHSDGNSNNNDASNHTPTESESDDNGISDDGMILMENELGEEDVKCAFVSFYLNLFGNGSWYMVKSGSGSGSGHTIVPDKNKFLQERYKRGDGQGSAMYPLLYYFVRTQLLDDYMNARVQERLQKLKPNPQSDMLFQCIEYIDKHQIAISPFDVKRIVKQMNQSQNSPKRQLLLKNEALRNVTLALTSTRPYEGNASEDVSKLCDTCRITTTKCVDVLDIIWMRLRYIRTQWKAALQALYLLRSLLLHGPLTTMSEALWGLEKIRALKQYQTSNRANALQIQNAAKQVCALLVDRSQLLMLRRAYAARKHVVKSGKVPTLEKIHALRKAPSFLDMHKYLRPKIYPATYTSINRTANDLLDFSARSSPPNSNTDINANANVNVNANAYTRTAIGGYGSDLLTASFTAATNSSVQNSNNSDNNGDPFHGTTASAATTTASSTMTVHPTKNALEQIFGSATTQTNPNPNTNTNANTNTNTNTQQANPFDVNSPPASGPAPTLALAPALALAIPVSTAAKPPPPRPTATTSNITLSSVPAPASDPLDIFGPVTSKVSDPFDNTPMKATPISAASLSSFAQPDNPFVTTTTTTSSSSSSTTTPASNTNVFDVGSLVKATPVVNPPSVSSQQQQQQQPQQFANPFTNAQGIPQSPYAMAPSHSHPLPPQQQQPSRYPLSSPPPQQLQQQQQQQQPPRAYSSNQYGNVAPPMGAAPRYYPPHAPNPNQPQPYPYQPQQHPHPHLHPHPQQSRGQQQAHPSSLSSSQQYNPYQQISQNNRSQFKNLPP